MCSVMIDAQPYKVDEVEHVDLHVDVKDGFELDGGGPWRGWGSCIGQDSSCARYCFTRALTNLLKHTSFTSLYGNENKLAIISCWSPLDAKDKGVKAVLCHRNLAAWVFMVLYGLAERTCS